MQDKSHIFLTGDTEKDTKRVTYFIFITAVSLLSLTVSLLYYIIPDPEISQVLRILDTLYAIVFLVDFILRYRAVDNKKHYMLHWGWLDLITSIPGIPALRIIRSFRVILDANRLMAVAPEEIETQARDRIAESVLLVTIFVGLIVISVGSILIIWVEADAPGAEITSGSDAMWWSLVTVSTVGYGDEFPVTTGGRIIGVIMIVVGVALFTTFTSYLASNFTGREGRKQRDLQIEIARQNAAHMEQVLERIMTLEEKIAEKAGVEEPESEDGTA